MGNLFDCRHICSYWLTLLIVIAEVVRCSLLMRASCQHSPMHPLEPTKAQKTLRLKRRLRTCIHLLTQSPSVSKPCGNAPNVATRKNSRLRVAVFVSRVFGIFRAPPAARIFQSMARWRLMPSTFMR